MNRDKTIALLLILIILFKLGDLYVDFANQVETHHLFQEGILILLSSSIFIFLIRDIRQRSKQAQLLAQQLKVSKARSDSLSKKVIETKAQFFNAIAEQFEQWGLTSTEKEVALLLVKGLSNFEIAEVRGKSEKTISHQASAIYKKAGVTGRHELAALFFEELIS
ncbi:LuxR C-terminal-related transcriptional regulator [Alteromonas sp. LMIT006]|uniref:helix-turn-helix transcriptional regulator n=1 Tax=Alteromonadaceae TaxID=72275 RepID=UPI0020CA8D71|nr:LuxR C-terminal-related transcriptional regulator [Alteromonas sp. LMIT006]UTP73411.1 LuxR C-terminal-related transcriptional regulator [Alteromonas sp. LMIT006]